MKWKLRSRAVLLIGVLCLPANLLGQDEPQRDVDRLCKQADAIRASAESLFKLQRIPWVTDPAEGFRLAKEERRPVFLYIQAGDPLEDC
jgi:hypothetical protein